LILFVKYFLQSNIFIIFVNMKKASLIIFENLWQGVKELNSEQQGQIFTALCSLVYEDKEQEPNDPEAKFIYKFYKKIVLEQQQKYEEISQRRSNARKMQQNATNENKTEQTETKINKTEQKKENDDLLSNKKENKKENKESVDLADAVRAFNDKLMDKLPIVVVFNEKRKQKLGARFEEFKRFGNPAEVWLTLIEKIKHSKFLCGETGEWKCTFDWLVDNSTNWLKVYEGQYENKQKQNNETNWQGAQYNENDWQ
jgi:hypothetical protein